MKPNHVSYLCTTVNPLLSETFVCRLISYLIMFSPWRRDTSRVHNTYLMIRYIIEVQPERSICSRKNQDLHTLYWSIYVQLQFASNGAVVYVFVPVNIWTVCTYINHNFNYVLLASSLDWWCGLLFIVSKQMKCYASILS